MNLSFLPNLITLIRVILLVPLSIYLIQEEYTLAFYLFMIAGFSDALDGFLAKRFAWVSRFGAILDPLADKALLVVTLALLTYQEKISWILFILVVLRDIYIVAGAYTYHKLIGPYEMHPSRLSKFNTFVQLLMVTSVLASLEFIKLPLLYLQFLVALTYVTTISSGIHYTWLWGGKAREAIRQRETNSSTRDSQLPPDAK